MVAGKSVSRKGYGICKKGNEEEVERLKDLLTVKPRTSPDAPGANLIKPFPVFKENSTKIYVPISFGYERYGDPDKGSLSLTDPCIEDAPSLVFNGSLRAEQDAPVSAFIGSDRGGIISLQCAAGKTVMALYIASHYKKKTLVICHKNFLIDQWKERIEQFLPQARVGLIKGKVLDVEGKDIVMASLQSLSMKTYDAELFHSFGLCIIDEVHHTGAEVFSRALSKVTAPIMLGLSATLNRKDGLRKVFEWFLGKPVYENKKRSDTDLIVRMVKYFESTPDYGQERLMWNRKRNVPQMINSICAYAPRNQVILDILEDILKAEPARKTIILSDRRNHLVALSKLIEARKLGSFGFYVGGMKPEELKASESKDIILGTYMLVSEGFDVPTLNTLIFASPISSIEQSVGRIQRQKPEVRMFTPLIVDIWDDFSLFRNQGFTRMKFYKKNGYKIICKDSDGYDVKVGGGGSDDEQAMAKAPCQFIDDSD